MVWVGRDLEGHLVPPPCHEQGPLPPPQGAQSPIHPGLEPCQGGGSHSFSGQPGPGPHHPRSEGFLPYIQYKSTLFHFKAITPCSVATGPCKTSLSSFLLSLLKVLKGHKKVFPQPSLPQAEQPSSPSLSSQQRCSSPRMIFVALLWTHSNRSMLFLCGGPWSWTQDSRWGLMRAE